MRRIDNTTILVLAVAAVLLFHGTSFAVPGDHIRIGNLMLSPFGEGSVTYDDNVFLTKVNEEEDFFADVIGGLAFINRTDRLTLRGRGWYQFRRYWDFDEKDGEGFGENLGLIWGSRERLELDVNQKFTRLDDYELTPRSVDSLNLASQALMLTEDRTERVKRRLFDIGAMLGRHLTDKVEMDAGYGYSFVRYEEGDLFDWNEHRGQVEAGYQATDKTMAILTAMYSVQDSDGFTNDPYSFLLRAGFLRKTTSKTSLKAGLAAQWYRFGGRSEVGDDLDITIAAFDVVGAWTATEKLHFELSGRNGIQPATQYESNIKIVTLAALGASYDLTPTWRVSLAGSFRQDDYVGRIRIGEALRDKEREHLGARFRVEYRPRARFYDVFAETTYEDVTDNLEDDYENYDQWRVAAGLSVRY